MNYKLSKLVSLILVFVITLNSLSFAIYEEDSDNPLADEDVVAIVLAQGYFDKITKGITKYYINPHVYREQQKVVYSSTVSYEDLRSTLTENQPLSENTDTSGEYRYLGYNETLEPVANGKYIPDVTPESGNLSTRNWVTDSSASTSWKHTNPTEEKYILENTAVEVDANVGVDTVVNILGGKASNAEQAKSYAIYQTKPGIRADGSVKMYHVNSSGQRLYWVLKIPALGDNLVNEITISPLDNMTAVENENVTFSVDLEHSILFDLKSKGGTNKGLSMDELTDNLYEDIVVYVDDVEVSSSSISNITSINASGYLNTANTVTISGSDLKLGVNNIRIEAINSYDSFLNADRSTPEDDDEEFVIAVSGEGVAIPNLTVIPDPSSVGVDGNTTTINVELRADLKGVDNIPAVWEFRLNGESFTAFDNGTQKKSITVTKTVDSSSVQIHNWNGEVDVYITDSDFVTATDTASTEVYSGVPPSPFNSKPEVYINTPSIAVMGTDVSIETVASDREDAKSSLTYTYITPNSMDGVLSINGGTVHFTQEGVFNLSVEVEDTGGLTDDSATSIWIVPPTPSAVLNVYGKEKVYREIELDSTSSFAGVKHPIDWSKTTYEIIPLEGQNSSNYYIGTSRNSSSATNILTKVGYDTIYLTSTEIGKVDVKLTITNDLGYSSFTTKQLDIQPDTIPEVNVLSPAKVYRDPSNQNKQTTDVYNISYSPDGDAFDRTVYLRQFDSDNDGNYDEETLEVFNGTSWSVLGYGISSVDSNKYSLMVNNSITPIEIKNITSVVGRTRFNIVIAEDFNDRNHNILNANDYIFSSIGNGDDKITIVDNIAPTADVVLTSEDTENVEIVVMTDYTGSSFTALQNKMFALQSEFIEYGKILTVHYIKDKNHVIGTQTITKDENQYGRVAYYTYRRVGREQLSGYESGNGSFNVNYYYNGSATLEAIWSLKAPSNNLFTQSTNIIYGKSDKTRSTMFSDEEYVEVAFYDAGMGNQILGNKRLPWYYAFQGNGVSKLYDFSESTVKSTVSVDLSKVNQWTNLNSTRPIDVTVNIDSFKLTDVINLTLKGDSKKVLLIASDNTNYGDFTLDNETEYSFGGIEKHELYNIVDMGFDVFVIAPNDILDIKFDKNQESTSINSQDISLREISESGLYGGLISSISDNFDYLKANRTSDLISSYKINNTTLVITLSEIMEKYDSLLLSIFGDITLGNGEILSNQEFSGVQEFEGGVLPLVGGIFLARIDASRQYIKVGDLDNSSNRFVYKVVNSNSLVIKRNDVVSWTNLTTPSISASVGKYIYVAEVDSSNRVKYMSVREVK